MPKIVFNSCCGCIELKSGCLIIGYLNLIVEIIFIANFVTGLVTGGVVAANGKDEVERTIGYAFMGIAVIFLLVIFFLFAFTIVLLVGIHQNRRGHVKAYLIVNCICLVVLLITTLASIGSSDAVNIVISIITQIISVYFLMVIRSYYYKMETRDLPSTTPPKHF